MPGPVASAALRRELEAAREVLRRELGAEPTLADLAKRVGIDVGRLERTIVRINTIESTSPLANVARELVAAGHPRAERAAVAGFPVRAERGPGPRAPRHGWTARA